MKTFAEMLPNATAEMREFVEAYKRDQEEWHRMGCDGESPYDMMLATPPAKEPEVSIEIVGEDCDGDLCVYINPEKLQKGMHVRVTKLEDARIIEDGKVEVMA